MGMRVEEGNEYGFNRKPSKRAAKLLNSLLSEDFKPKIVKNNIGVK